MHPRHRPRPAALLALGVLTAAAAVTPALAAQASPTASEIVYVRYTDVGDGYSNREVVLQDLVSGATRSLVPLSDLANDSAPELSPDGTVVAFATERYSPGQEFSYGVALVGRDGTGAHRLTDPSGEEEDRSPSWSPDSRTIALTRIDFASTPPVQRVLRVSAYDGSVLGTPVLGTGPAFSPDGTRLSYTDPDGQIVVQDLRTGATSGLGISGYAAEWSPDGGRIAFYQGFGQGAQIHVARADGSGERAYPSTGDAVRAAYSPHWLPDGQSLVYNLDPTVPVDDPGDELWSLDLQTGRAGVLAQPPPGVGLLFDVDVHGPTPQPVASSGVPSRFVPVTPARVFDSRSSESTPGPKGRVGPGASVALELGAAAGVPAEATAVVLNVTAGSPSAATYVTAYPTGSPVPAASNVNLAPLTNVPNAVTVATGTGGRVSLYNSAGTVDLVADLAGYYTTGAGVGFAPLSPTRLFDSRASESTPGPKGRLVAGGAVDVAVRGVGGVPADATAVVVTVTGVASTSTTLLRAYPTPSGDEVPLVSTVNLPPNSNVANLAIVRIGDNGKIRLRNEAGTLDAVVDVSGYYAPSATAAFVPAAPTRFLDTRNGTGAAPSRLGAGDYDDVRLAGTRGVPDTAVAIAANLTAVAPTAGTLLRAYPAGTTVPLTSNLNVAPQTVRANAAYLRPDPTSGRVRVRNDAGQVHVLLDVAGWFVPTT